MMTATDNLLIPAKSTQGLSNPQILGASDQQREATSNSKTSAARSEFGPILRRQQESEQTTNPTLHKEAKKGSSGDQVANIAGPGEEIAETDSQTAIADGLQDKAANIDSSVIDREIAQIDGQQLTATIEDAPEKVADNASTIAADLLNDISNVNQEETGPENSVPSAIQTTTAYDPEPAQNAGIMAEQTNSMENLQKSAFLVADPSVEGPFRTSAVNPFAIATASSMNTDPARREQNVNSASTSGNSSPGDLPFIETISESPIQANASVDFFSQTISAQPEKIAAAVMQSLRREQNVNSASSSDNSSPGDLPIIKTISESPIQANASVDFFSQTIAAQQEKIASAVMQPIMQPLLDTDSTIDLPLLHQQFSLDKADGIRSNGLGNIDPASSMLARTPAGSPDWNTQIGDKIRWMATAKISTAELVLHPAELGSLEIKITTEDDQTRISFITTNSAAKEVIEASLPKLRDLLSGSGLQLEQSDVSQRNQSGSQPDKETTPTHLTRPDYESAEIESRTRTQVRNLNQIDHYV